ncbi:DUF4179 domain-containing protein [Paenibacillus sp. BAC0078]
MNKLERALKHQLNNDENVPYPDFEGMWKRMEDSGHTATAESDTVKPVILRRSKNWSRIAGIAALSALLAAAPVYAAIHYNWDNLLHSREGIQSALDQNLGQQLGQSITKDGVTFTLHTAIVDENRTVILYSLDVGKRKNTDFWNVKGMTIKGTKDSYKLGETNHQQWDEQNQRYNGYFESDWTPQQDTEKVILTADGIDLKTVQSEEIPLNPASPEVQSFNIGREGMQKIDVQPLAQSKDKLLLLGEVTFDDPSAKEWAYPQIAAYNGTTMVKELPGGTFGEPGDHGEYKLKHFLKADEITPGQTSFKLQYWKQERNIAGPWSFELELSKKQMESGTIKKTLNVPLEPGATNNTIEKMVITPTQIRLTLRNEGKGFKDQMPYKKSYLLVNGRTLEGGFYESSSVDHRMVTVRFERPSDLVIDGQTPIIYVGKYKVTVHDDDKAPIILNNISAEKQTFIRETGGYPVQWTYYMQGKDLFIETGSEDPHFGGINQTNMGGKYNDPLGKPVTSNFDGDGNNKAIDVYKNFKGTEASVYMYYYTTDDPDKETRVTLQP